jgi:hypothetical protein
MLGDVDVEDVRKVEHSLRQEGFKPFEVELGGMGVGILEAFDEKFVEEFKASVASIAKEEHAWLYWG